MGTRKTKTTEQIIRMQARSAKAYDNLWDDPEAADEIEAMTPEEYAESKGIQIVNPHKKRSHFMTRAEAEAQIRDLEAENEELRDSLAEIRGIIGAAIDDDSDDGFDSEENDEAEIEEE